jgi:diguanylate cyclase (GGDEF)-like protein
MGPGNPLKLLAMCLMAWLGLLAAPLRAEPVPLASTCHAATAGSESFAALGSQRWNCDRSGWDHTPEATYIRFTLKPGEALPVSFVSRIGRYTRLDLTAIDADGTSRTRSFTLDDARPIPAGPYFSLPLPTVTARTATVVARVERPWVRNILAEAQLSTNPKGEGWTAAAVAAVAAICGLLCAPLLFNVAFYRVLREPFILWHIGIGAGMLGQAVLISGLIHMFGPAPLRLVVPGMSICLAIAVASAAMFTVHFIEPGKLSPRLKTALRHSALPSLAICTVCSLTIQPLRPVAMNVYYLTLLPMTLLFLAAMAQAWWRGSRMVMFQIVGWAPSILIGFYRVFSNVSTTAEPSDALLAYNAALAFEVVVTALGVTNRFLELRRERDLARHLASEMQGEAEHDPLTGLFNRRGIESRFGMLREAGFNTVAVIDLDHFKLVNDSLGHHTGDQVLAACASALQPDEDVIALRMGGEEFMLLLRGADAANRAEARRRAVTQRVGAMIDGLPGPVTASMGLIEFPRGGAREITFEEAYGRADRLLYEAKRQGRNRTVSERLTLFERRSKARSAAAA